MDAIFLILLLIVFVLLAVFAHYFYKRSVALQARLQQLRFDKASQSVKYGKTMEQFLPFSSEFPFSKKDFRFIGTPIDGIAFEEDKVVFVEFKAASAQLSERQKQIKQLVQNKKIEWFELNAN